MSLILEALRKSEAERRRAQAPDLFAEPQLALPRLHPGWPRWAAPVLAGIGLIALLALLRATRPQATPVASMREPQPVTAAEHGPASRAPAGPASTPVSTVVAPAQPSTQSTALPAPAPPRMEPASPATPVVVATTPAFAQPRMPSPPVADAVATTAPQAPSQRAPVQPTPAPATIPTPARDPADDAMPLSDLGSEERQRLPTLKLSMHMWNDAPAQRFVILDGQRLGEGDRIGDAVVERITQDGAILDWNGRRLRVSMR